MLLKLTRKRLRLIHDAIVHYDNSPHVPPADRELVAGLRIISKGWLTKFDNYNAKENHHE